MKQTENRPGSLWSRAVKGLLFGTCAMAVWPGVTAGQTPQLIVSQLPDLSAITAAQSVDLSQLPIAEGAFGGTWDSNFGQLRLIQTDGVVIGDYADKGILIGEMMTQDCIAGVFTNGSQLGEFSFRIAEPGRFVGVYRFGSSGAGQAWDGNQTSLLVPANFSNFNTNKNPMPHIANDNAILNGAWQSGFGELRLRHSDLFLFGDYADRGIIAARWDGQQFQGVFTNTTLATGNQVGWATFGADILAGQITDGSWSLPGGGGGTWPVADKTDASANFRNIAVEGACQPMWPF